MQQPPPYGSGPKYGGLRPLAVGEMLDRAIQIYRHNFRALVTMTAVAIVPIEILTVLVNLSARSSRHTVTNQIGGFTFTTTASEGHDAAVRFAASIGVILLSLIAVRLAVAACTRGVTDAYIGGVKADARSSLRVFFRALPSVLWLELLTFPAIVVASFFCLLPGVWLWISWLAATPILLIEGARGTQAIGRSFALVQPRWWSTFGVAIVAYLLGSVVRITGSLLLVGVVLTSHDTTSTAYIVVAGVIAAVCSLITTPFVAVAYVIVYFDLRVRREGLDLQMVFAGLDQEVAPTPAAYPSPSAQPPTQWGTAPTAPPAPAPPPPAPPPPVPPQ